MCKSLNFHLFAHITDSSHFFPQVCWVLQSKECQQTRSSQTCSQGGCTPSQTWPPKHQQYQLVIRWWGLSEGLKYRQSSWRVEPLSHHEQGCARWNQDCWLVGGVSNVVISSPELTYFSSCMGVTTLHGNHLLATTYHSWLCPSQASKHFLQLASQYASSTTATQLPQHWYCWGLTVPEITYSSRLVISQPSPWAGSRPKPAIKRQARTEPRRRPKAAYSPGFKFGKPLSPALTQAPVLEAVICFRTQARGQLTDQQTWLLIDSHVITRSHSWSWSSHSTSVVMAPQAK